MTVAQVLQSWGVSPAVLERMAPADAQYLFTMLQRYAVLLAERARVDAEAPSNAAANYADWVGRAGALLQAVATGSVGAEAGRQLARVLVESSTVTAAGIDVKLPDVAGQLQGFADLIGELPAKLTGSLGHALRAGLEGATGLSLPLVFAVGVGVVLLGGWYLGPALVGGSTRIGLSLAGGYGRALNTLARAAPGIVGVR